MKRLCSLAFVGLFACGGKARLDSAAEPHDSAEHPGVIGGGGGGGAGSDVEMDGQSVADSAGFGGDADASAALVDGSVLDDAPMEAATDVVAVDRYVPTGPTWVLSFGDIDYQAASALAVAPDGTVFVGGTFKGGIDFGNGVVNSVDGSQDAFVASFDPAGNVRWKKPIDTTGYAQESVSSMAVDRAGDLILAGDFNGTINFGGGSLTSPGGPDVYIARLGGDGRYLSAVPYGDAGSQRAVGVAVTRGNEFVATGEFMGSLDRSGGFPSAGAADVFLLGFDSAANEVWRRKYGDFNQQLPTGIAARSDGSVALVGQFGGTINFGLGGLVSISGVDIFLAYLDSSHTIWSKRYGSIAGAGATPSGVAIDEGTSRIAITGLFQRDLDFGCGSKLMASGQDGFLAVFDAGGQCKSAVQLGSGTVGTAVAFAHNGDLLAIGEQQDTEGGSDLKAVLWRLAADGHLEARPFSGNGYVRPKAMGVDEKGNVYVAGSFEGPIDLVNRHLVTRGEAAFLARLDGAGI